MKSILSFRDSLTWGFEAGTFLRYDFENRQLIETIVGLPTFRHPREGGDPALFGSE